MNDKLLDIGLKSGMLNYVDNETPRNYFISAHADEEDLEKFAELIIRECADIADVNAHQHETPGLYVLKHFDIK
jgi:hypothetical protein